MRNKILALALAAATCATLLIGAPPLPVEAAEKPPTSIDSVAWLAGRWRGTVGGAEPVEEMWTVPAGRSMMGAFRWLKDGELFLMEVMSIEEREDRRPIMWLRHLGPGLVTWEEKDGALLFELIQVDPNLMIFEHKDGDKTIRVSYQRERYDRIIARFESTGGGEDQRLEFVYRRAD